VVAPVTKIDLAAALESPAMAKGIKRLNEVKRSIKNVS
jgi:hypothetical protein